MKDDTPAILALLFVLAALCFMFGTFIGSKLERDQKNIEAVKRGHATWVVSTDGSTVFQWNESCK
jgi:uncharacterized SAM-binding protein YcdF (DUF218 family)